MGEVSRPLLVGLQNPLSDDPRYALYPEPDGCTGHRLYEMLGVPWTHRSYLRAFDRVNLLRGDEQVGGRGYMSRLRRGCGRLVDEIVDRKSMTVVLLGADVFRAVFERRAPWLTWRERSVVGRGYQRIGFKVRFLALPHPSGQNRWYNRPGNREAAARELRQLAEDQSFPHE